MENWKKEFSMRWNNAWSNIMEWNRSIFFQKDFQILWFLSHDGHSIKSRNDWRIPCKWWLNPLWRLKMPDTLCRRCGYGLITSSECQKCFQTIKQFCPNCKLAPVLRFHIKCLLLTDSANIECKPFKEVLVARKMVNLTALDKTYFPQFMRVSLSILFFG